MIKSFFHIIFATVLIFSILAPTVFSLIAETDTIVLLDISEEEKSEKKEKEKEKKILTHYRIKDNSISSLKKKKSIQFYLDSNVDFTLTVLLPPPEHII